MHVLEAAFASRNAPVRCPRLLDTQMVKVFEDAAWTSGVNPDLGKRGRGRRGAAVFTGP